MKKKSPNHLLQKKIKDNKKENDFSSYELNELSNLMIF